MPNKPKTEQEKKTITFIKDLREILDLPSGAGFRFFFSLAQSSGFFNSLNSSDSATISFQNGKREMFVWLLSNLKMLDKRIHERLLMEYMTSREEQLEEEYEENL